MKKIIIVPIDGSQSSLAALEEGIALSKKFGDELRILNVQQTLKELGLAVIMEGKQFADSRDVQSSSKIRTGIPAIEIISEANDPNVRYIVMAIGKGKSEDIGSVSRRVLELANCPVILVP